MIKVTCQVDTLNRPSKPSLMVHNHWNQAHIVELDIGEETLEVNGQELIAAINNCMNTKRH